MDIKKLKEEIIQYSKLDSVDVKVEIYWKEMTDILSENIDSTISFFKSNCSDEELYWLSSVFEDVVKRTNNKEFVEVLQKRLSEVTPETYSQQNFQSEHMRKWVDYSEFHRCVGQEIDFAEGQLKP
jgi:hypothetical protein